MTTTLLVRMPRWGPESHPALTLPAFTRVSMSPVCERTARSASKPEAMERAWAPEALYDSSKSRSRPVWPFQRAAKAGSSPSWKTSRTTEYAPILSESASGRDAPPQPETRSAAMASGAIEERRFILGFHSVDQYSSAEATSPPAAEMIFLRTRTLVDS